MADKLSLYNGSLGIVGERKLASLSENRAPRRRLDTVWDSDSGVKFLLEQGLWNFAMDTVELTYSPSVTPAFGYTYAFDKPAHWRRTALVSDDPTFANTRVDYKDEGGYLYANCDTLYVKFVSSANNFGGDLSLWTAAFTAYAESYFAGRICLATTNSQERKDKIDVQTKRLLSTARSQDAMNETVRTPPPGSWARARRGSGGNRSDGGSSSNLIG